MPKTAEHLVRDVMTDDVATVGVDCDVHELEKLLVERGIHGAPVVDGELRLVGVVSQTDLLSWHYELGVDGSTFYQDSDVKVGEASDIGSLRVTDIKQASVTEVMSPVTHVIGPDESAGYAASRMMELGVHRLIVVDDRHHVVGIVSAMDLLRLVPGSTAGEDGYR